MKMSQQEKDDLLKKVDLALEDLRPHLAVDGGNIEVVEITDERVAKIKWLGNCEACSMSAMTLRAGVEETLRSKVPEIQGVKPVNGFQN
jgi:Fe-S cluster biogenesis protein NfuA